MCQERERTINVRLFRVGHRTGSPLGFHRPLVAFIDCSKGNHPGDAEIGLSLTTIAIGYFII